MAWKKLHLLASGPGGRAGFFPPGTQRDRKDHSLWKAPSPLRGSEDSRPTAGTSAGSLAPARRRARDRVAATTALHKRYIPPAWGESRFGGGGAGIRSPGIPGKGRGRCGSRWGSPGAAARRRRRRRRAPPHAEEESLTHVVAAAAAAAAEGSWELQLVMLLPRRKASLPIPQAGEGRGGGEGRYRPGGGGRPHPET